MNVQNTQPTTATRRIVYQTRGFGHGGITRLMSPGDLGEMVKPFVFLDRFEMDGDRVPPMPNHPHSGIATHTTLLAGTLAYEDSTGKSGVLSEGSIEYMQAGGGVWHGGKPGSAGKVRGFQLWLALPPELELAPAESHYIAPEQIPGDGRVRVLLGSYDGKQSPIAYPVSLTYLHVTLRAGESWSYQPDVTHELAWLAVSQGALQVDERVMTQDMAVFEDGTGSIAVTAVADTDFVIASGVKHPHELVTGMYSVHTSREALKQGEAGYRRIAAEQKLRR